MNYPNFTVPYKDDPTLLTVEFQTHGGVLFTDSAIRMAANNHACRNGGPLFHQPAPDRWHSDQTASPEMFAALRAQRN